MNISVHLQFTSLAAAVAFLAAGDRAAPGTAIAGVAESASTTSEAVNEPGKSESAAPAAAPAAAKKKGAASAKASDTAAPPPSPSTGETSQPTDDTKSAAKLPAYADTDLPARIMKIVETSKTTGDKTQVEKLKAALAEFGVKSAKDLTPEQVVEFAPKLAAIEAPAEDDDNDIA
jgi:hypothetical protein